MRDRPTGVTERDLVHALAEGWGLLAKTLRYAPVGGGSYHWVVIDDRREPWFVTVDDLDDKGWLGRTRPAVFASLRAALDTAVTLRDQAGPALDGGPRSPSRPGPSWPGLRGRCAAGWMPWTAGPAHHRGRP